MEQTRTDVLTKAVLLTKYVQHILEDKLYDSLSEFECEFNLALEELTVYKELHEISNWEIQIRYQEILGKEVTN